MEIPVLIEPVPPNGFRARSGEPLGLTAEGATREEALQKLRELVTKRIADGGQMVPLDLPAASNPWLRMAGIWEKDDPLIEEWKQAMEENRRAADADPDYL
jgi:predicted RNase H-like HicB family nuclease